MRQELLTKEQAVQQVQAYRIKAGGIDNAMLETIKAYPVELDAAEGYITDAMEELARIAKQAGKRAKETKDWFEARLIPVRALQKDLTTQRAELLAIPSEIKTIAGQKTIQYQNELQRRINEHNERIRKENEAKAKAEAQANAIAAKHATPDTPAVPVVLEKEALKAMPTKAVNTRKTWKFEITGQVGEHTDMLIDYLIKSGKYANLLDMAIRDKISQAKANGTIDKLEIAGVRIYQDDTLVLR